MGRPKKYPVRIEDTWWVVLQKNKGFRFVCFSGELDWGKICIYFSKEEAQKDFPNEETHEVRRVIDLPDFLKSEVSFNIHYYGLNVISN